MARRGELVAEERLAERSGVRAAHERVHQVRVVAVDLLRAREVLEGRRARRQQPQESGALQRVQHPEAVVAVGLQLAPEVGHPRDLRDGGGEHHQHLARLADRGERDGLRAGIVDFEDLVDDAADPFVVAGLRLLVEGVVARLEVAREERKDLHPGGDVAGDGGVAGQELVPADDGQVQRAVEGEKFAEGKAGKRVGQLPAGEVSAALLEL